MRQIKLQWLSQVQHISLTFKYTLQVRISLHAKRKDKLSKRWTFIELRAANILLFIALIFHADFFP